MDQAINRQIDEELAKANAEYGPRHFDLVVPENNRDERSATRNWRGRAGPHTLGGDWVEMTPLGGGVSRNGL